jgi:hypothetical protein
MRRGGKSCTDVDQPDSHALILSDEGRDSYTDVRHSFHLLVPRAVANLETSVKRDHIGRCEAGTSDHVRRES